MGAAVTLVDPMQGSVLLAAGGAGAGELSGLSYVGTGEYLAVSDSGGVLFEIDIDLDLSTGEIDSASVVGSTALAAGTDLEGLVHLPLGGRVLASDETGPAIREYQLSDGAVLDTLPLPAIYSQIRSNFSLESLALYVAPLPVDDALYTANEEALLVDGPLSSNVTGSVVRIQRFDSARLPAGQWAYVSDPYPGNPFLNAERSGVSELLALPTGELLAMERSFSSLLFRTRIYQVDFSGATDITSLPALDGATYTPVGKTLLWERSGTLENFEGMALGPELAGGDRSLLLVSDNGGGSAQVLYPLRVVPEASATFQLTSGLAALCFVSAWRRCSPSGGPTPASFARRWRVWH